MFKVICSIMSLKSFSMVRLSAIFSIIIMATINVANAHDHKGDDVPTVMIHHAWARALPPVVPNGAAYLQIHNVGTKSDTLLSVSTSIAKHSMVHESYFEDGKVAMRHINNLVVNAGESVEFKPGGFHIMLMGLKEPLNEGTNFELVLNFKMAGAVQTTVKVTKGMIEHAGGHDHH